MKFAVAVFCIALLGSVTAVPVHESRASALELFDLLENIVEDEGHALLTKVVHLIHKVEEGVISIQNLVPKVYEKVHEETNEVLADLKKVSKEIQELLVKKSSDVLYGFDFNFLGGLTELTGNTKLTTVLHLISLADKTHKVVDDAKGFVPHLEKELDKIQKKLEAHVTELSKHVLKELGISDFIVYNDARILKGVVAGVEEELFKVAVNVIDKIEGGILTIKELVPKVHVKIHEGADKLLAGLKKVFGQLRELMTKKHGNVLHGFEFDFEGALKELTGSSTLGNILVKLTELEEDAHKVINDAIEVLPHLKQELYEIQEKIKVHVLDMAEYIWKKFGFDDKAIAHSYVKNFEDLIDTVEEELHKLALTILRNVEEVFDEIKTNFPETYERIEKNIEEIRKQAHEIVTDIRKRINNVAGYGVLDFAGDLTSGTSLGTAIKLVSLLDKFNTVIQDVKGFEPHAEIFLHHTVIKVQTSAQDFFTKAAKHLLD